MTDPADHRDQLLPPHLAAHWYNAAQFTPSDPWRDFRPQRTALILVDLINWQVGGQSASIASLRAAGHDQGADYLIQRCEQVVLPNLRTAAAAARKAGIRIVHARLASRHPDYRDIVPALRPYVRAAEAQDGSHAANPIAQANAAPGDLSIIKSGSGAFNGTELDFLLRREGIDTLIYAGVVTSACVLLSVATGFDLGYRQYLLADATGALSDRDQGDAERLIGNYMAQIVRTTDLMEYLNRG